MFLYLHMIFSSNHSFLSCIGHCLYTLYGVPFGRTSPCLLHYFFNLSMFDIFNQLQAQWDLLAGLSDTQWGSFLSGSTWTDSMCMFYGLRVISSSFSWCILSPIFSILLTDEMSLRCSLLWSFNCCFSFSLFFSFFSSSLSFLSYFPLRFGWNFGTSPFFLFSLTLNRSLCRLN